MEPVISVQNVNYYFGTGPLRTQVLYDVSTEILPGEIVILTGPSGSGKTTLLTLAGALRTIEDGSVRVLNSELNRANQSTLVRVRKNIGFIFQAHNLLGALTAWQNVKMSLGPANTMPRQEVRRKCVTMLQAVGMGDRVDYYPEQLSGGQKQRVAIARALVRQPKIVLADEPTASLDRKSGREVVELLHKLAKQQNCAILLVTHDNRILDIADRILSLEDGRITSFASGMAANTGHLLTALSRLRKKGGLGGHLHQLSKTQFLDTLEQMSSEFEQFLHTLELGNRDVVEALFDEVLQAVTEKIRDLLNADRGTIFLVDRENEMLRSKIAHGGDGKPLMIEAPLGAGIASRVAKSGESMNIADPYSHPDFNPEIDRETGYRTRSILCMPLRDRKKNLFAVVQILNRKDGQPFDQHDEKSFLEFEEPLGVILESCARLAPRSVGGLAA